MFSQLNSSVGLSHYQNISHLQMPRHVPPGLQMTAQTIHFSCRFCTISANSRYVVFWFFFFPRYSGTFKITMLHLCLDAELKSQIKCTPRCKHLHFHSYFIKHTRPEVSFFPQFTSFSSGN